MARVEPLDSLVERTLAGLAGEPLVFFLGAGASAASPSCLPQPKDIQRAVFDCVAPAGAGGDRELIAGFLPEIYHEVLLEVGGPATRAIWSALRLWELPAEAPELARLGLGPNLVHQLVAYLSWRQGRPVVTVNFDQMLERAAASLGLAHDASLGARPGDDRVAIWKLHGSVEDLGSIRTTVQGITAVDRGILTAVEREFQRSTGCLIGYTGRDIDFFPFLCGWRLTDPVWWLSLDIGGTAIDRYPEPFRAVDARAEEWARRVVERMPVEDAVAERLKAKLEQPTLPEGVARGAYDRALTEHARKVYAQPFPAGDPSRVLAHAMTMAAIGRNGAADRWAAEFLAAADGAPARLLTRGRLLRAAMAHEFARYEDSDAAAREALGTARRAGLRAPADEAILRLTEARRMLFLPPRLPYARSTAFLRPRALAVTLSMLLDAVRLWPRRRAAIASADPDYSRLRASFEYLEHLVRVGALAQSWLERLLRPATAHRLVDRYWRWLEERCYRAGYAMGIGNTKKYLLRRRRPAPGEGPSPFTVLDLYELVPSPTGASIHHRDAAEVLAEGLARIPAGPDRERQREKALRLYDDACDAAREAGDPSLELKAMLGIVALDGDRTWRRETVAGLIDRVQSPAFQRYRPQLMAALAPPPGSFIRA